MENAVGRFPPMPTLIRVPKRLIVQKTFICKFSFILLLFLFMPIYVGIGGNRPTRLRRYFNYFTLELEKEKKCLL